jgi:hypothetical protein
MVNQAKNNVIKIFHQNVQGLRTKCSELLCHLQERSLHVLCFTKHHLENDEIAHINLDNYLLGAHYSRKLFKKGGTCIYIHRGFKVSTTSLDSYCCDNDIEACAVCLIFNNSSN